MMSSNSINMTFTLTLTGFKGRTRRLECKPLVQYESSDNGIIKVIRDFVLNLKLLNTHMRTQSYTCTHRYHIATFVKSLGRLKFSIICVSDFIRNTPSEIRELRIIPSPIHMLKPEYDPSLIKHLSWKITATRREIYNW